MISTLNHRRRDIDLNPRGFTLLEVLVAFVIASLAIAVLLGAAGSALNASHTAGRYDEAAVRARSRLEQAIHAGTLIPGQWEGDDGAGYRWRVRVAPSQLAAPPTAEKLTLYAITVWISWREGRANRDVRLDTERIGHPFEAP